MKVDVGTMAPKNLEVIVGTYEQFLLGYTVDDIVNKYKLEQSFATHSHLASIRSVASNKHYLASAAADDTVCLYDMRTRTENGKLVHHSDTVNSICFTPDASHIITASNDGTIGIVRCGNWQVEKHWLKPHKGLAVDTLAVHPTGKLAMTTGHDGVLRTWNLIKGRQAYATNLVPRWKLDAKNICILKWSPSGNAYLIGANNRVDIYSIETAGIEEEISFDSKVACAEYLNDEFIAIGLTDGKICIYDLINSKKIEIQAHEARVKCLARNENLLVSASSSGEIKLWSFEENKLILLSEVNCSARISCMTLSSNSKLQINKKDEVELEEVVSENLSNKLRLKQQVIIEDEIDEKKTSRMSKKQRDKKKARKLLEENNEVEESKIMSKSKKIKTKEKEHMSKKKKKNDDDLPFERPIKKKRLSDTPKKRKSIDLVDEDVSQFPTKKEKTESK